MRRLLLLAFICAATAQEKAPAPVAESDKQALRLVHLELENITLRMAILERDYSDLAKKKKEAQEKLDAQIARLKEVSNAKGYDLAPNYAWVTKNK